MRHNAGDDGRSSQDTHYEQFQGTRHMTSVLGKYGNPRRVMHISKGTNTQPIRYDIEVWPAKKS